jgi:hypothetical protein
VGLAVVSVCAGNGELGGDGVASCLQVVLVAEGISVDAGLQATDSLSQNATMADH